MTYRVVIYDIQKWIKDEELLTQLEVTGIPRPAVLKHAQSHPFIYLNNLEEARASGLLAYLRGRSIEAEMEPMRLEEREEAWLIREGKKWIRRGVLFPYQLASIFQQYGVTGAIPSLERVRVKDRKALVRSILTIGTVLVGLGIILFIASNWRKIPPPVKIGGCLAFTLTCLHLGYYFRFVRAEAKKLDTVFLLLSLFGIGGCVILIGQIYHVLAESHVLPFTWGLLAIPLALGLAFEPAFYFTTGLWLCAHFAFFSLYDATWWTTLGVLSVILIPFSVKWGSATYFNTNLVFLMAVSALSGVVEDLWASSWIVLVLVALRTTKREPRYEFLLMAVLVIWELVFVGKYEKFPNAIYLLPIAYFAWQAIVKKNNALAIANIFNALFWVVLTTGQIERLWGFTEGKVTDGLLWMMATGVLFYGLGLGLRQRKEWRSLFQFLAYGGLVIATAMAYALSFRFYSGEANFFRSPVMISWTILFSVIGILKGVKETLLLLREDSRRWDELGVLLLVSTALILSFVLPAGSPIHPVVFNLVLFSEALVFLVKGYREKRIAFYNWGIAIFIILIVSRYFDTFWAYLPRSSFFILGGIFLIVWALFIDRQRKSFVREEAR